MRKLADTFRIERVLRYCVNKNDSCNALYIHSFTSLFAGGRNDDYECVKSRWFAIAKDIANALDIWNIIAEKYQESGRYYHNLHHITDMLNQSEIFKDKLHNRIVVDLSIIFHDLIYDGKSATNEEDSAILFRELLDGKFSSEVINKVFDYIIETKKHAVADSKDSDLRLFIDFDMSILGSSRDLYFEYARKIRKEYVHIEFITYCEKRAGFLRKVLSEEDTIYSSAEYEMYEQPARENIKAECEKLEKRLLP